jgi:hypothetical protein
VGTHFGLIVHEAHVRRVKDSTSEFIPASELLACSRYTVQGTDRQGHDRQAPSRCEYLLRNKDQGLERNPRSGNFFCFLLDPFKLVTILGLSLVQLTFLLLSPLWRPAGLIFGLPIRLCSLTDMSSAAHYQRYSLLLAGPAQYSTTELPPYTRQRDIHPLCHRELVDHIFTLANGRNKPWATLKLLSSATSPKHLPTYYQREPIVGSLALSLEKEDPILSVSVSVSTWALSLSASRTLCQG